jgi:hypothetical protein
MTPENRRRFSDEIMVSREDWASIPIMSEWFRP